MTEKTIHELSEENRQLKKMCEYYFLLMTHMAKAQNKEEFLSYIHKPKGSGNGN